MGDSREYQILLLLKKMLFKAFIGFRRVQFRMKHDSRVYELGTVIYECPYKPII